MTIHKAYSSATGALQNAMVPDPEQDAGLLLSHITGIPRLELRLKGEQSLTLEQEQRFSSLLLSRTHREPLQYLLGEQCFYGLDFLVDQRVLIPRQETETLCELGIAHIKKLSTPAALDLCTGSGALAVTLKHECPPAQVTATDLSADALAVAKQNAERNHAEVRFLQGDLFAPLGTERFDLILSNPPYIPSEECNVLQAEVMREPRMALDGGQDGLLFYRRMIAQATEHLTAIGLLGMEVGERQASAVAELLRSNGHYEQVCIHKDLYGLERVVTAHASGTPT
ncbi:MAG: peptide chain release factor N(5)-glutamine methyltransferase [Clostridia bacterium]